MPQKFTLADKAYYVAQYLEELREIEGLPPRTVCERYTHAAPGEMGLEITAKDVLSWANELSGVIATGQEHRRGS
jgi:hypothetical protein